MNPYLALASLIGCGMYGIEHQLDLIPETIQRQDTQSNEKLPSSLKEATLKMLEKNSLARMVLGDAFVQHYGQTRLHECNEWSQAVTHWEVIFLHSVQILRYFETA